MDNLPEKLQISRKISTIADFDRIKGMYRNLPFSTEKDNIKLSNQDAEDIIEEYYWPRENILFIDPPYYVKGRSLYNLYYKEYQHKALADLLNSLYCSYPECADILITYDNDQFIKELFPHSSVKEIGRTFSIAN